MQKDLKKRGGFGIRASSMSKSEHLQTDKLFCFAEIIDHVLGYSNSNFIIETTTTMMMMMLRICL